MSLRLALPAVLFASLLACSESGLVYVDPAQEPATDVSVTPVNPETPEDPGPETPPPPAPNETPEDPPQDPPEDPPEDPVTPPPPPSTQYCWTEDLEPLAPVDDLRAQFNGFNARPLMEEVLERRFPACADLLVEMQHDPYIDIFLDSSSWESAMDSLGTICHEETHGYDYEHAINPSYFSYWQTALVIHQTDWIDALPRSVIWSEVEGTSTDLYTDLYLTGTQGTYGFTELLDETTCYVNGLGGTLAGADNGFLWGISGRDGAVAFLYYIELYLRVLEIQDPATYTALQNDPEVTDLVRDLWLRTHFLLQFADQDPRLGINDGAIRTLLYRPDNQGEIEDFLGYPLDASNCLP